MRKQHLVTILALAGLVALLASCGGRKVRPADLDGSVAPDRVLYEQALEDIRRNQHTVGRLTLQTLINTYPDSEYLAKAKLAIADSYYKEGGSSGLTQAVAEYKDFITFFPHLPEAVYAQMQIARAHYRRMEKPDRDRTQARLAEHEFQNFLLNYPDHELVPVAKQRLREVQEVLAEGDFRVARYYYVKGNLRAAAGRLIEITDRYPLYSQSDRALWMLGEAFEKAERIEVASRYYSRIIREYPLSGMVEQAQKKLVAFNLPVPQPDPEAVARMQAEAEVERERPGFLRRSLGIFRRGPDVSTAAHSGEPNLTPPSESAGLWVASPGADAGPGQIGSTVAVENVTGTGSATAPPPGAGESSSRPPTNNPQDKKKEEEKKKKDPPPAPKP